MESSSACFQIWLKYILFFPDFTGYITRVTKQAVSDSGSPYFDLWLKTSPNEHIVIKIMMQRNQGIHRQIFIDKKLSGEAVTFHRLTRGNRGIFFYNSTLGSCMQDGVSAIRFKLADTDTLKIKDLCEKSSGRYTVNGAIKWLEQTKDITNSNTASPSKRQPKVLLVRNGLIADETGEMIISVWGEHIDEIEEYQWYTLTDVNIKHFYGKKLTTNMETSIRKFETSLSIDWDTIDVTMYAKREETALQEANPIICCPEIDSAEVNIYPVCKNQSCLSKVEFQPGDQFVKCVKCSQRMLLEKCLSGFTATLDLSKDNAVKTLTVQPDVLSSFFGVDVLKDFKHNATDLEEKLLLSTSVDFTHNAKNVITEMKRHVKEDLS